MTNLVFSIISFLQARFDRSERGEVSLEYVLVGGLAAAAIVAGMLVLSPAISTWFSGIAADITGALPL